MKQYILRSMMFVPGNNEKLLRSASQTNADAIILDLEDSIINESKQEARDTIKKILPSGIFEKFHIFIRLNDRDSEFIEKDVLELMLNEVTGFLFPKSYGKSDIIFFENLLEKYEAEKGFTKGKFKIIPLIETASAILHAEEICRASKRIIAIAYGSEDFCADIQGIHDKKGKSLFVPRALIVMAARAAGVIPIDTTHVNVHDLEDLEDNMKLARILGFEGMLLLHPKEIELAHKYFSPTKQDVENAELMLKLTEEAATINTRVAILDGVFIGPPMLRQAKLTLVRNKAISDWENSRK
jgi:citrate lyase subunit beta / citryl-CoA lyase